MPTSSLPLEIKNFLNDHFESVTHLEILFNFFVHPEKEWTADSMGRDLRTHPAATARHMQRLSEHGLITHDAKGVYRYKMDSGKDEMVKAVHSLYLEKPVAVIACIYERPNDKLKGFADAFKLKKD